MSSHDRLATAIARVDARALAFVGGQGKSGTTWVQLLLDAHPQVSALGEGLMAESLVAPLFALGERYRHAVETNNARFPELPDFPPPSARDLEALARAALVLVLDRLAERKPAARVLVERTPDHIARIAEFHALFPDARFVHVLRDPRDVAVSLWHHGERLESGSMRRSHGDPLTLARALVPRWAHLVATTREVAAACGANVLEVRYEDLHADAHLHCARLFRHLGVDDDARVVETALAAADFERLSGRRRGQADARSHFRAGVSGGWRSALPDWDGSHLDAAVLQVLDSLGYPAD